MINTFLVFLIAIFFIFCCRTTMTENLTNNIPKHIFTYWDKHELPKTVQQCQQNWRKFAPNYKIHTIHQDTAENWVQMPPNWKALPPYRQADILRLKLLEKYGGIWMDASILLMTNPDNFVDGDLTMFTTPSTSLRNPVYENWFIASSKGNPVITEWVNEVLLALKDKKSYIANSNKNNTKLVGNNNYLICHLVLRNIYSKNPDLFKNGKFYESINTAFAEHKKHNWTNVGKNLFKNYKMQPNNLIIKMRGSDRRGVENIPADFIK